MRHSLFLLLLAACLSSCTVGETITLNKDLSGTKVIEFELPDTNGFMDETQEDSWEEENTLEKEKEDSTDLLDEEKDDEITEEAIRAGLMEAMGDAGTDIAIIEQLFAELDNISNYKMEQDDNYLRVSFGFNSDQPQVGDKQAYDLLLDQLSDGTKWYFKYIPNTFSRVSRKEVRWNILNVDLFNMDFKEYQAFSSEMGSATMLLTVHFAERIKSVDQPNIIISPDRRSLKCMIELSEISDLKRSSQVLIRFQ